MHKGWVQRSCLPLIAALGIAGCATAATTDFVVALPNGYYMTRGKSDEPHVVKRSGGTVIPGPVASYSVVRDVVTGLVPPPAEGDAKSTKRRSDSKPGYFVLKTRTGELDAGLTEEQWKEALKALGIEKAPELAAPVLPK